MNPRMQNVRIVYDVIEDDLIKTYEQSVIISSYKVQTAYEYYFGLDDKVWANQTSGEFVCKGLPPALIHVKRKNED